MNKSPTLPLCADFFSAISQTWNNEISKLCLRMKIWLENRFKARFEQPFSGPDSARKCILHLPLLYFASFWVTKRIQVDLYGHIGCCWMRWIVSKSKQRTFIFGPEGSRRNINWLLNGLLGHAKVLLRWSELVVSCTVLKSFETTRDRWLLHTRLYGCFRRSGYIIFCFAKDLILRNNWSLILYFAFCKVNPWLSRFLSVKSGLS